MKKKTKKEKAFSRCKRCGRILRNPEAVKIGYGICCFKKLFTMRLKPLFRRKDESTEKI